VASAGRDGIDPSRIPTGQYYERGFLVLSAGPTPPTPLEEWTFSTRAGRDRDAHRLQRPGGERR
jgi:hypothetical protein